MATTITAKEVVELKVSELVALGGDIATEAPVAHNLTVSRTLNATSTPKAEAVGSDQLTIPAGPFILTVDLTAFPYHLGGTLDFTGKKVQSVLFKTPSTNTGTITIEPAAANGYNILGDASGQATMGAGAGHLSFGQTDALPAVGASAKDLTITGTVETDTLQMEIVVGT